MKRFLNLYFYTSLLISLIGDCFVGTDVDWRFQDTYITASIFHFSLFFAGVFFLNGAMVSMMERLSIHVDRLTLTANYLILFLATALLSVSLYLNAEEDFESAYWISGIWTMVIGLMLYFLTTLFLFCYWQYKLIKANDKNSL